ncbi:MAG TPA: FAD:protein FMN transferase [Chryseolinea sp.]|nr:FAD:protein FMN transferase [Chryseolinea sp.]
MNTVVSRESRRHVRLMGSDFQFVIIDDEQDDALDEAIGEVKRIENLLTEFSDTSQTSLLNQNAGIRPVFVDDEVYRLIKRCKELSGLTQGAFDVTSGVLKRLYNFKGENFKLPDADAIAAALLRVGSEKIKLKEPNRVYLSEPGMHIGFGAIGKGYAADVVKRKLIERGINGGVINASGDLTVFGRRTDGSLWKVGIADPNDPSRVVAWLPVENASVATSGNYEQYFERDGIRYSHNIDPRTGKAVKGIKSVTVVSASAELSDALATAVTIMGVEVGLHFFEQLPGTHCLIITDEDRIFTSRHLRFEKNGL